MSENINVNNLRFARLNLVNERWPHQNGLEELALNDIGQNDYLARWCLVEVSTHNEHVCNLSLHESPAEAEEYWSSQEEPDFWHPQHLIDLDTGAIHDGVVTPSVEFHANSDAIPLGLKPYRVGVIYQFHAEDEAHAIEQFSNAVGEETPDPTFVEEVRV